MKHFLKLSLILFAAILLTSTCEEPEYDLYGSVFGMITNSKTNEVVSGAQVVLAPGNITAVTGADGNYEFQELEPGQFRLTVSADGYESYTRQITVVVGERIICDVQLTPLEQISDMELSTDRLDFGTSRTELTFNINNIGTAGDLSWTITNITVPWLSVTPDEGTTEQGKSSSVKVVIDRDIIKSDVTTSFNVEAAGGSKSVSVSVVYDDGSYNESDMVLSEKELDFGTEYDELSFYVRNTGASETLVWSIDEVTADWLTVSPTSGNTAAGKSTSVRVTVNRSLLTKDADAVIIVKAENGASESVKVTVKYDGSNEKPDLDLSVNELDFGHDLNQMSFEVLSVGTTGTLEWSVTEISVPWLSVSPTSGSTPAGSKESVVVTIDRTQITKDENTVFTVSADGVSESVKVSVDYAIDEDLSMELSESILDFGRSESELSFNIMNTAQTLDLNWKITGIKEWMTVTPSEGVTEAGRYTTVSITVDWSKVLADETAILIVEADGLTEALVVNIKYVPGEGQEDYSSATVRSGDSRIIAEIVSCKRSGSNVVFEYTLKNDGLGDISLFYICNHTRTPRTLITDEYSNQYTEYSFSFNGETADQDHVVATYFPELVKSKGSFTIKNFDSGSELLTIRMGVEIAISEDNPELTEPYIYFENVPIY